MSASDGISNTLLPGSEGFLGRVALVTGAGRGIGREIAIGLAGAGASIILASRSIGELEAVQGAIEQSGGVATLITMDVGDPVAVGRATARLLGDFGAIDILINNAGVVWPLGPFPGTSFAEWDTAIAINLVGPVQLAFALLPAMIERGWGRIVNVSSGIVARPTGMVGANAYSTSKAALESHTVNLAVDLVGSGVTANAYRPGRVDTAMQEWIRSQSPEEIGNELHDRFVKSYESGELITAAYSAHSLLERIASDVSGEIWSVHDA